MCQLTITLIAFAVRAKTARGVWSNIRLKSKSALLGATFCAAPYAQLLESHVLRKDRDFFFKNFRRCQVFGWIVVFD